MTETEDISAIEVTVYCLAYNHGRYIRSALEGFVSQKTDFKYQVIIHDDASIDETPQIIQEYAEKYPEIIIPILQKENQYQKGVSPLAVYIAPLIKGKYVATCEGDDYWVDNLKLQKQYDIMENNKKLSACVHNTIFWDQRTNKKTIQYSQTFDGVLSKDLIFQGGSSAFHTSSLFMRREYIFTPSELTVKYSGDIPRAVYLGLSGDIYYLKDVMSVYRQYTPGSWSDKINNTKLLDTVDAVIKMLNNADKYSNFEYHGIIEKVIREKRFLQLCLRQEWRKARFEYQDVYSKQSVKKKVGISILAFVPGANKLFALLHGED